MAKRRAQADYLEAFNPGGYVANGEITNLPGHFMVRGSKNMRVINKEKIVSSPGYILQSNPKTVNKGIISGDDWYTSSGIFRNLRHWDDELEVWYDNEWLRLKDGLLPYSTRFAKWWNATELIDTLIFVNHTNAIHEWSGCVAKIQSVTANTITKQGYYTATTIAFVEGGAGVKDTITDSANGFVLAGFKAGDTVVISGSTSNNGTFLIDTVTAGTLTLSLEDDLTDEAVGDTVIIKWPRGTWAEERALTTGTRKLVIDGVEYTYTGGETTGTLTGVTPDPSSGGVANGDIALQAVRTTNPADFTGYSADLITTLNNHCIYGSHSNHTVYVSKNSDFDNFAYTAPLRVPGEGFEIILDSAPTAFIIHDKNLYISAGLSDWYRIRFELAGEQGSETIIVDKLDTTFGQSAIRQECVVSIKKNVAYLSNEKAIDSLSRVESINANAQPMSYAIKDDLEQYDTTNACGTYYRGQLRYSLPKEGLELIYDLENGLWHAPENKNISAYAFIDGKLCGHSSVSNETYILDTGRNANGAKISHLAVFGYDNFGTRLSKKVFDELAGEVYFTPATTILDTVYYDYQGSTAVRTFTFTDDTPSMQLFAPSETYGLGSHSLGAEPFGSTGDPVDPVNKRKGRYQQGTPPLDFFERQRTIGTDSMDGYLEILAYGENIELSDSLPA